jgi:hypothetical protein
VTAPAAALLAAGSAPVENKGDLAGWVVGLVLFIALLYWLMRQGWKWRATQQSGLPPLVELPRAREDAATAMLEELLGRYHGSTSAGEWLDRIIARDLGVRSLVELNLTEDGLRVVRPAATDFLIPRAALRGARTDKGIAGKVLPEGGLLVVTWEHGGKLIDSGFRSNESAQHGAWVEAINRLVGEQEESEELEEIKEIKEGAE